jgi:CRISPR-associated protein Csm3
MYKLKGKLVIKANLKLVTGMHIGTSGAFSAIGAVDSTVIRDPFTKKPIIPGSSLKGKMRYLLSRTLFDDIDNMPDIRNENIKIKRLFGSSDPIINSRLKFKDIHLTDKSSKELYELDLDLPYTEIKFENTIDRAIGKAMPRQQERIPAGADFNFEVVYDIEDLTELNEDIQNIKKMTDILEYDYLGGHGSRGYGRVKFENFTVNILKYHEDITLKENEVSEMFNK